MYKTPTDASTGKQECSARCKKGAEPLQAQGVDAQKKYYYSCLEKCDGVTQVCKKMFVDCSRYGGYDPSDRCRQTCLKKEV